MNTDVLDPRRTAQVQTLADVVAIAGSSADGTRRRDLISAIERISEMMAGDPRTIPADVAALRPKLNGIRPAAHNVTAKTFSNLRSLFVAALAMADVVDPLQRGLAASHPMWAPVVRSMAHDKRLVTGLAAFANWCASSDLPPMRSMSSTSRFFWRGCRTEPLSLSRLMLHVAP